MQGCRDAGAVVGAGTGTEVQIKELRCRGADMEVLWCRVLSSAEVQGRGDCAFDVAGSVVQM